MSIDYYYYKDSLGNIQEFESPSDKPVGTRIRNMFEQGVSDMWAYTAPSMFTDQWHWCKVVQINNQLYGPSLDWQQKDDEEVPKEYRTLQLIKG